MSGTNGSANVVYVTHGELREQVNLADRNVESLRADIRALGEKVSVSIGGLHALTSDLQRQIGVLVVQTRDNHTLVLRLLKQAFIRLQPKRRKKKTKKGK